MYPDAFLEPSDEEVLAASDADSDSAGIYEDANELQSPPSKRLRTATSSQKLQDSDSEASAAPEEDEDAGGWGTSRRDYYDADKIETEADALEEEAEARRLQQKQLQGMTEADFGFDEIDWKEAGKDGSGDEDGDGKVVREVLPKLEITDDMGPEERIRILRTRYPEFEPLAKEFVELRPVHDGLKMAFMEAMAVYQNKTKRTEIPSHSEAPSVSILDLKYRTLGCYLAALCMYFALFTSGPAGSDGKPAAMPAEQLRDHTIMESLVQFRDAWQLAKDLPVPAANDIAAEEEYSPDVLGIEHAEVNGALNKRGQIQKKPKHRKSKAQKAAEAAQAESAALQAERLRKTEENLADLSSLTKRLENPPKSSTTSSKPTQTQTQDDDSSDFGDQTTLTPHEAAQKALRKKSLRFYTSQIAQKSNKRGAAGRDAGGDADIPYRERLKDRQARLNAEAEKRGKKPKESSKGDPLGGPSDEEDHATAMELRKGGGGGEEDYYDLVASRSAEKKAAKAALAAARAQAEKEGGIVRFVEEEGVDGKRAISYAIEKNKGLAPKRKKDVRNPRVKKRKKIEEKKKKLGSSREVYKGGEGRGGYAGELTGIKKNLVKSIKL